MAIEGRRIAKNTGLLYIRMLLLMAVSLYTSRIVLSTLGVVDFGIYNVVGGVVVMLGFLSGTLNTASSRFITVSLCDKDLDSMKSTFNSVFIVNLILALVVLLLSETIGLWFLTEKMIIPNERHDAAFWVYQFSVITVFLNIVTVPFNASIIAHERMGAFAYISLIDAFAKLLIVYLIRIAPWDRLVFYAFLMMAIHVFDFLIYNIYCLNKFSETRLRLKAKKSTIQEILNFIVWASYGSFVSVGFTQGLNVILNMFFGPSVNAARGIAVQVQTAVTQFTNNFQIAINPQLIKKTAQQEFEDARTLLIASSKYSFLILCMLGIPIIIEAPFILGLWLEEVPEYSVSFCRIMICICIWGSLANPLRTANQAEGHIRKFQIIECTLLLLIMPISYISLRFWDIPILVFVVHLIIELSTQIVRIKIVVPKIQMTLSSYFVNVYYKIVPVFFLPFLVVLIKKLRVFSEVSEFFIVVVLVELIILFSSYYIALTSRERTSCVSYVCIYLNKVKGKSR